MAKGAWAIRSRAKGMKQQPGTLLAGCAAFGAITVAAVLAGSGAGYGAGPQEGRARKSPGPRDAGAAQPVQIERQLVAYWDFDDSVGATCRDRSGHGRDATGAAIRSGTVRRVPGLFGEALWFSGNHRIEVRDARMFDELETIGISAWVQPVELSVYREIFRKEDGDNRVLFSFQHDGTILSLGLNIDGRYLECDAKIDPQGVLDGRWHHCAATYDGRAMRVYLDGQQVGELQRPGRIRAGGTALACIGSSNGGECFQGAMDELRIYAEPLTAEEIAALYRNGLDSLARLSECVPADEPTLKGKPMLAHWTFNERGTVPQVHDSGPAALQVTASRSIPRVRGVHGHAIELHGDHALPVRIGPQLEGLAQITLSAWVRPSDLGAYREIFRQECAERILFSFQDHGTILSLGLNIAGEYIECDAEISPAAVLDGGWHHAAAAFDGKLMRVYLDGRLIGELERPGKLATNTRAVAFIGSNGGRREYFQGALDDLRIYREALTADQIRQLFEAGLQALQRRAEELAAHVATFYRQERSFAETLAHCRRRLAGSDIVLDAELAEALRARLRADFPKEYENFVTWTEADLIDYLTDDSGQFEVRAAERLIDLMLEYKPLTERQWAKCTTEERRRWQEAERIAQRFEQLQAQGSEARFSPAWIELILEAGSRVTFRPRIHEAVAPYVKPDTPPTGDLSGAEARELIERDWLHQADGNPTLERIRDEIRWARKLAARIKNNFPDRADFSDELRRLARLEEQAKAIDQTDKNPARSGRASRPDQARQRVSPIGEGRETCGRTSGTVRRPCPSAEATVRELYFAVRSVKRRIMFKNPVIDFNAVLFIDQPYPQGKEWRHETRHRLGYMAVPGGRLLVLEGLSPSGHLRQLAPQPPLHGSFWRPDLSWDAQRVLFCFKPHNEKSFHLYEVNIDGTGLRQLTDGPYDDLDPIYLPDEQHIIFTTTRSHTYVRCMPPTNAYVLARCDRDGRNIYLLSRGNEPEYTPSVMPDGRIIYTRWEYTDKPLWRAQSLWTMSPDGTDVQVFWGNQSVWPDLLKDARAIPGSHRIMFTGSAHHNWFAGSIGIIDPNKGFNFPAGLTKVTAELPWPESGNGPVDPIESPDYHATGRYSAYYSPYPLSEQDFLVSACRNGKFVLYLMDTDGNRELIYEGVYNIFHAMPVRPRPRPPALPEEVAWPKRGEQPKPGILYSSNIYEGMPAEITGKVRYLRVLNIDHKTYTYWYKRPYASTGPVVSLVQSEGIKRVLGTVPVEPDGSVAFEAPPGVPLHFQLLDESYRALQTMRSFTGVMPGERRGCLGCHESHSRAPAYAADVLALRRPPSKITPPPWQDRTISYDRYVQPVLDRYCGECHQGDGEARQVLDLTRRRGWHIFPEPYVTLTGHPTWGRPYTPPENPPPGWGIAGMLMVEAYDQRDPNAYYTPPPMTALSYRSRLIELASSGKHYGVKVDPISLRRLILWVDTMCPWRGEEEVRSIPDPVFQGVDWLAIRPRIRTAPRICRPGPVD